MSPTSAAAVVVPTSRSIVVVTNPENI